MALIETVDYKNTDYLIHPLMNLYTAHNYIDSMSDDEKKNSHYDNKLFGSDKYKEGKGLNIRTGEAIGLGLGALESVGMGIGRNKQMNQERDMLARKQDNDYLPAMSKTNPYNVYSDNFYNNSYFADGGESPDYRDISYTGAEQEYSDYEEVEDQEPQEDVTNGFSPFDQSFAEDELTSAFLSSLFDGDDDNYSQVNWGDDEEDSEDTGQGYSGQGYAPKSLGEGSIAVRHNNPGNIKFGAFAQKFGAQKGEYSSTEKDGSYYSYFPTIEAGLQAQRALLKGANYRNLTVPQALNRWAAGTYKNQAFLNMFGNKRISELTDHELDLLQKEQIRNEDGNMYRKIYG